MSTLPQLFAVCALLLLAPACRSVSMGDSGLVPGEALPERGACLTLHIDDARDASGRTVPGSAGTLAVALRSALQSYGWEAVSTGKRSVSDALDEAAALRCELIVQADYLGWAEAGAHWIETPDRVEVRLRFHRASDGALLAWGHDEVVSGTLFDAAQSANRLVEPLVLSLALPIFTGEFLDGVPEAGT